MIDEATLRPIDVAIASRNLLEWCTSAEYIAQTRILMINVAAFKIITSHVARRKHTLNIAFSRIALPMFFKDRLITACTRRRVV